MRWKSRLKVWFIGIKWLILFLKETYKKTPRYNNGNNKMWTIIQAFSEWLSVPNKTWTKDKIRSQTVWMESGSHALYDRGVLYKLFSNVMVSRRVTHFTAELFAKCKAAPRQSTLPWCKNSWSKLWNCQINMNKHTQTELPPPSTNHVLWKH